MANLIFKDELKKFCQSTSIKGIPRAAKAENNGIRVTWILSVFIFVAIGIFQTCFIILEYIKYPSYIFTHEKLFDPVNNMAVVPTLTFCNQNPFSSLANQSADIPTLEQYYALVHQATLCPDCDATQQQTMQYLRHTLHNPAAYFENLGHQAAQHVSHDEANFILSCKEVVFFGMTFVERECTDLVSIHLQPDVNHFNCYRIETEHVYDVNTYGYVAGLSVVLYLDNIATEAAYQSNLTASIVNQFSDIRRYGAIVTPTHYEGYPFIRQDGIQLPAGMSANIQLFLEKKKRLQAPHGECVPTSLEAYEYLKMCLSDCFQKYIRKRCNCTDARMAKHMDTERHAFCLKVHNYNVEDMVNKYSCASGQFTVDNLVKCTAKCPQACLEIGYATETSLSKWPSHSSMGAFYRKYIANRAFEAKFRLVKEVIEGNCSDDMNCLLKLLAAQRVIEDNFLEVNIHLSDFKFLTIEQIPKFQIADLFSKVGGILNLWAGITVVILLELIEMMLRILWRLVRKKKNMQVFALAARRASVNRMETVVEKNDSDNQGENETIKKGLVLSKLESRIKAAWKR